jgi:hypothetical protein
MRHICKLAAFNLALAAAGIASAHATLNISNRPTKNVDCSAGVCRAFAADAVMNAHDLAAMLDSSDITLQTTGDPQDMEIVSPFAWSSAHALTLQSSDAISIRNTITVRGTAHLSLAVPGGPVFQNKGAVRFLDVASGLTIDGDDYRLVNSIASLAAVIAAHPRAFVALANDYDAHQDGQVTHVPVATEFGGTFDGLGNTISNFSIWDSAENDVALFKAVKRRGVLRNIAMVNVNVLSENTFTNIAAGLVAYNGGTVLNCSVSGGTVRTDFQGTLGGLVGLSYGSISRSWANVSVEGAQDNEVGGLIGNAHGHVQDVYALGRVIAGDQSDVGGLIGYNFGHVRDGYATGHVSGGQNARVGGVMGTTQLPVHDTYWDTEASGTTNGVGNTNIDGITGMTTAELQSGLPHGFVPGTWAQDAAINGGLPYLPGTPPR